MRKFYLIIVIVLLSASCFAQQPVLNTYSLADPSHRFKIATKGSYAQDTANDRDQYVGTWLYNQNGVFFEIKMEKADQYLFQTPWNYYYLDVLLIRYKLIKNGMEIYNNYNSSDPEVLSDGIKIGEYDYLSSSFLDVTRQVLGDVTIEKLPGTPEKIIFDLSTGGYMLVGPPEIYQEGVDLFSIPTEPLEMVKVN